MTPANLNPSHTWPQDLEPIESVLGLTLQVKYDGSPVSMSEYLTIGLALMEELSNADDPVDEDVRRRFLECLARIALSLSREKCEEEYIKCCTTLLEEAMKGLDEGGERDDSEDLARLRHLYAMALWERYLREKTDHETLDQAMQMAESSVQLTKTESLAMGRKIELWMCLYHRSLSLKDQDQEQARAFLVRSVQIANEVYQWAERNTNSTEESGATWLRACNALAMSYREQWDQLEDYGSLIRSLEIGRKLCQRLANDQQWEKQHDAKETAFANQSYALLRAYGHWCVSGRFPEQLGYTDGQQLLDESVRLLEQSTAFTCDRPRSDLENVITFVSKGIKALPVQVQENALGRISNVLAACIKRMRNMALYASREDLLEMVASFYGLARYASAAALAAGAAPYEALRILEEGRGLAFSIQLGSREDDTLMARVGANSEVQSLWTEYLESRRNLLACVEKGSAPFHERHALVQRVLELQRQLNSRVPEFNLETCPPDETLTAMARDLESTIVVVNITDIKSDAFIVTSQGINVVPLPEIDENALSDRNLVIQHGLCRLSDDMASTTCAATMIDTLKLLWKWLVHPVLKAVGRGNLHPQDGSTPWSHVCWIPTGVLCLYPIHAAGPYKISKPHDAGTMSRVVSSYAPSLKLLYKTYMSVLRQQSRERSVGNLCILQCSAHNNLVSIRVPLPVRAAVIIEPEPPSDGNEEVFKPLRAAETVTQIVQRTFSTLADGNGEALILRKPSKDATLRLLRRRVPIVQFFCHGFNDYDEPLNSKLLLEDWRANPLTAGTLMSLDLRGCRLAFLSACWSAHGGVENLQDEVNHIACALQVAGVPTVIASLWEAVEDEMVVFLEAFYSALRQKLSASAAIDARQLTARNIGEAFHIAVLQVRERSFEYGLQGNPILWAPFVRFGI